MAGNSLGIASFNLQKGQGFLMDRELEELKVLLSKVEGMLTQSEAEYLYRLAKFNPGKGVIVEIGSYKGKSTICLARGSIVVEGGKVFAIDPHLPIPEEGYSDYSESRFRDNIQSAGVGDHVVHLKMTSNEAAQGWNRPIRLLWIDGDHRYEQVRQDFLIWEPHVIEGGIIAMHDTIRKKGPKRVLWESIFLSNRFQQISIVDNITSAWKTKKASLWGSLTKWITIGCRALYIGARKVRLPYAKPVGRWILRKLTT